MFDIDASVTATLSGLNITGLDAGQRRRDKQRREPQSLGLHDQREFGVYGSGFVQLRNSHAHELYDHREHGRWDGGGLFNAATANLTGCTITEDLAAGVGGGTGGGIGGSREYRQRERRRRIQSRRGHVNRLHPQRQHRHQRGRLFNYGEAAQPPAPSVPTSARASRRRPGYVAYAYKDPSTSSVTLVDAIVAGNGPYADFGSASDGATVVGSNNLLGLLADPLPKRRRRQHRLSNLSAALFSPPRQLRRPDRNDGVTSGQCRDWRRCRAIRRDNRSARRAA